MLAFIGIFSDGQEASIAEGVKNIVLFLTLVTSRRLDTIDWGKDGDCGSNNGNDTEDLCVPRLLKESQWTGVAKKDILKIVKGAHLWAGVPWGNKGHKW
jgi:hypothetical protein